jgi:hypothetical protein
MEKEWDKTQNFYTITIPNLIIDQQWLDYEECYNTARYLVNNTAGVKFAVIYNKNMIYTILIKKGYGAFNFKQFNQLEIHNRINDFFILHQNGIDNYYIKLKTK